MPLVLESAGPEANKMVIDNHGRAHVLSVSETEDFHINKDNGKVWAIPFEGLNPAGANDYVVYIKNTGDKDLDLTHIYCTADTAASQVEIHKVSGTAAGGSDITPVAENLGSAQVPSATIQSGTDITGLTNDGVLHFMQCVTVNKEEEWSPMANIIIPKGFAIAILVETATANITGTVVLLEAE